MADILISHGWPTACIAGSHDQRDRNEAMSQLKTYKCRVLISTDLVSFFIIEQILVEYNNFIKRFFFSFCQFCQQMVQD